MPGTQSDSTPSNRRGPLGLAVILAVLLSALVNPELTFRFLSSNIVLDVITATVSSNDFELLTEMN